MTADAIKAALAEAAKRFCICDGECFETRHGMMNGPCEARLSQAAAAIAAFHVSIAEQHEARCEWVAAAPHRAVAAAVGHAAREGGG